MTKWTERPGQVRWRRQYRLGMFGASDPAHLPLSVVSKPIKVPTRTEGSVTLLPVQTPETEIVPDVAPTCIDVIFACATVRISGSPETATLRMVLDALARRS